MAKTREQQRAGWRDEIRRTRENAERLERKAADPSEHPGERDGARRRAGRERIRIRDLQDRIDFSHRADSLN